MADRKNNEIEIDLLELFRLLWSDALVILLAAAFFCAAALGVTVCFVTPKYKAEASMYVNNSSSSLGQTGFSISSSDLSASASLAKTYAYILKTRETIEEVIKEAGLDYTYEEMMEKKKMISTEEITGTAIFKVTITGESPTEAELIANTIVKVLPKRIEGIIDGSAVRTVSFAIIPSHRMSPNYLKNAVIGFIFGAFFCCVWIVIRNLVKRQINGMITSADDLRKRYPDTALLALIPDMRLADRNGYYYSSYYSGDKKENRAKSPLFPASKKSDRLCENLNYASKEAFKRLRTNILLALPEEETEGCRIVGVTGAQTAEGKSTVAVNTAYSLAELGKKVLLIDADMRYPSVHTKLALPQTPGLNDLLSDGTVIDVAVKTYHSRLDDTAFNILPAGMVPPNPSEILGSGRMKKLLKVLSSVYDYIVLDLPPLNTVIDAVSVGKHTDGMIVVVRENTCPAAVFDNCIEQLKFADIKILGFVINGALEGAGKGYPYKYRY